MKITHCQKCQSRVSPGDEICAECGAVLFGSPTTQSIPDNVHLGRAGMVNMAITLAFVLSFMFSPGGRVLKLFLDVAILKSIPVYQGLLISASANYWVPAIVIYLALRTIRADQWVRSKTSIQLLFGLANALLLFYLTARIFASSVEGGGASFVVKMYARYFILPAFSLIGIGAIWMLVFSIKQQDDNSSHRRGFRLGESIALTIMLALPATAGAYSLYLAEDAPYRLAKEAEELMDQQCKTAGEFIMTKPDEVEGIYLEPDGGRYFNQINNGIYRSHGSSIIGAALVNSGYLKYFEKKDRRSRDGDAVPQYRRHGLRDHQGELVTERKSRLGVFQTQLIPRQQSRRLKVYGTKIEIKNLETDQLISSLTYFTSKRHRRICGHEGTSFRVTTFIRESLNLEPEYPKIERNR